MARISLLLALALVLAIASVSAHPPSHKKTKQTLCPATLGELQAFPSHEISKLLEKTEKSAAKSSIQFQTLFAVCKSYNVQLLALDFHDTKKVVATIHGKFALMTEAMLRAQAVVGVDGELAVKLRKSYAAMAERYVLVAEKVASISADYKFNANAKISISDRAAIEKCVIKLRGSIRVYLNVIAECNTKFSGFKKVGFSPFPIGFFGASLKKGIEHGSNLIGFGGQVGAGAKVGAQAAAKVGAKVEAKANAGAKVGANAGAKAGAHAGANAQGNMGGLFGGYFGFGGKAQFDAAGKAHVGGGIGFRSLSNPHKKHLN